MSDLLRSGSWLGARGEMLRGIGTRHGAPIVVSASPYACQSSCQSRSTCMPIALTVSRADPVADGIATPIQPNSSTCHRKPIVLTSHPKAETGSMTHSCLVVWPLSSTRTHTHWRGITAITSSPVAGHHERRSLVPRGESNSLAPGRFQARAGAAMPRSGLSSHPAARAAVAAARYPAIASAGVTPSSLEIPLARDCGHVFRARGGSFPAWFKLDIKGLPRSPRRCTMHMLPWSS